VFQQLRAELCGVQMTWLLVVLLIVVLSAPKEDDGT
jgi:hypothetical protein